ncbi:MAG: vgb [Phycisphaerales bacterium]|nr:vgb [Phycisphaerales bacterium]
MKTLAIIESLEPRRLLSVTVENLQGPPPAGSPPQGPERTPLVDLTVGGDKYIWYTANIYGSEYPWLVKVSKRGRSTDILGGLSDVEDIGPVAAGPGGTTYVNTSVQDDGVSSGALFIYKFEADGSVRVFSLPERNAPLQDMTVAADGSVYYSYGTVEVMRMTDQSDERLVATATGNVRRMVTGPDGAIWFTETGAARIGRLTTAGK